MVNMIYKKSAWGNIYLNTKDEARKNIKNIFLNDKSIYKKIRKNTKYNIISINSLSMIIYNDYTKCYCSKNIQNDVLNVLNSNI